jgi:hypothetical protein
MGNAAENVAGCEMRPSVIRTLDFDVDDVGVTPSTSAEQLLWESALPRLP